MILVVVEMALEKKHMKFYKIFFFCYVCNYYINRNIVYDDEDDDDDYDDYRNEYYDYGDDAESFTFECILL